ncbi:MAG: bifunctional oligoribonuclease/PAP phosphatase NrnA [Peptococcaceae bacterium]|nr:bifunctional oligoribonuclease/PAP phosphatase NrnA [Peptococcaceae bacterium]
MPDGDCLGSVLALGLALEKMGKKISLLSADPVPSIYHFLPGSDRFMSQVEAPDRYDLLVTLDVSSPERMGETLSPLLTAGLITLNIDHHASTPPFANYNYVDANAAAVGEIIFDLIGLMGVQMDRNIATCLYVAIMTDTGCFRYEHTTAATHLRAAKLIEYGVSPAQISTAVYEQKSITSLKVLAAALDTLQVSNCGRVAWMTLTPAVEQTLNVSDEDVDGIINYARAVQGVEVAVLFRYVSPDKCKIGFRSKTCVDVAALAQEFGGGGHPRASGCVINGDCANLADRVIDKAVEAVRESDGRCS